MHRQLRMLKLNRDRMRPLRNIKKDWEINNQGRQFHWLQNISQKNLSTMQYGNFFNDYIPSSATIL